MKMISTNVIAVAVLLGSVPCGQAQSKSEFPEEAKFAVHLDLKAFRRNDLGEKLIQAARQIAAREISRDSGQRALGQIEEALGFDPLEEVQSLTVIGSDFERPERDLRMVLRMKKTTGNLEGLLLALPGYESFEYGDHTIHTAAPEDGIKAYAVIHETESHEKQIFASLRREHVEAMLDRLPNEGLPAEMSSLSDRRVFATVQLREFPHDELDLDGPPANIARLLQEVKVMISGGDAKFSVDISLTTEREKNAEQLQQLAQGMVAMIGLAQGQDEDDEDLKRLNEILQDLTVLRDGNRVRLQLSVPNEIVIEFLRDEVDLPL